MAVTRIKNNQITDATITAAKIASGTLTGGLFASDLTLNSNVTISGNLTLQGNVDSISATNTFINDPLVVFNNGFVGVPAYDIGILVNRNLTTLEPYGGVNAAWIWREELDAFTGVLTTETGTTAGTINNSGYANLVIGNVTANSISLTTGSFTAAGGIINTPISGSTGYFTTAQAIDLSTGNALISGGIVTGLTTLTATTAQVTNLSTGNALISGGTVTGLTTLTATTAQATNLSTGNAVISGGYISSLSNITATTAQLTNFESGNIYATGTTSGTWSTANVALYEQLTNSASNGTFYVPFYDKATGNAAAYTNTSLSFNPSTGALTATEIYGTIMGTTSTANVALYENLTNSTTDATHYVNFYDKATGNAAALTNTSLTFNPSTGTLSATTFSGTGAFTTLQATNFSSGNVAITGGYASLTNVYATTSQITNLSTANAVISGGYISALSNITATTGSFGTATAATLNATAGNITTAYAQNFSTANAEITGGSISGLTNLSATTLQATNFSSGNVVVSGGYISALTNATITTASITNLATTTSVATNFSTGNAVISGGYISSLANIVATTASFGTATAATLNATGGNISALYAGSVNTANAVISGGYISALSNITATTASFGTATAATLNATAGNVTTLQSTNFSSGNVVISGGYISALSNITATTANFTNGAVATLQATNFNTANAVITGGYINNLANLTATTAQATNFSTGNAVITGGYADNFPIGANVASTANISTLNVSGQATFTNNLNSTEYTDGAVVIYGGLGVYKDVHIGGNLYVSNIIAKTESQLTVTDPLVYFQSNVLYPYSYDIGFFSQFIGGAANVYQHTGVVRNHVDGSWGFFSNIAQEPDGVIPWGDAGRIWDPIRAGQLYIANTTPATSTTSGALQVSGGAGIEGNLYAGNINTAGTATISNVAATSIYGTFYGTIAGGTGSANVSLYQALTDASVNSSHYIAMYDKATGNAAAYTNAGLTYNPSTSVLTATTVSATNGAVTTLGATNFSSGNIQATGTTSGTWSTANVSLYNSITATTTNDTFYPFLADKTAGNTSSFTSSTLTYNPSTGVLSATTFSGAGAFTTLQATNFSSSNVAITGGYVNNLANVTATSGTIATVNATAANITTAQATNFSTGNAVISGGYISSLSNITATTANFDTSTSAISNTTAGNVTTLYAGSVNTANAVISGGYISAMSNIRTSLANVTTANIGTIHGNLIRADYLVVLDTINTNYFTALDAEIIGGNISNIGYFQSNVVSANLMLVDDGSFNTLSANILFTSNAAITGGNIFQTPISGSTGYFSTLHGFAFSTANAVITGGYINNLANLTATTVHTQNFSTANAVISGGYITGLANVAATTGTITNLSSTTAQVTNFNTGNAVITGGYINSLANLTATTAQVTNFSTGNAVITGGYADNFPIGANTASTGAFTTLTASSAIIGANLVAGSNTESISSTTGALVVIGGTGIGGNITAANSATFNSGKTAGMDFVVKGKTDETLIWARPGASYDQVVIGNSATTSTLVTGAKLIVNTTDSMLLPAGTTAQRPSSTGGTDTAGMFRYNQTIGAVEWYTGSIWQTASSEFTTVTDTQFNGDGATTEFTSVNFALATTNGIIVSINGVLQIPTLAYSLGGSTITFTEAPANGDVIDVRVIVTTETITALASPNGYMGFMTDNNGVYITTGTSAATVYNYYNTDGAFVSNVSNVSVASANTATTIDTLNNSLYRSAKYTVQVTNGAEYQVAEALVIQNGTTATITTYGIVQTAGNLGVLAATVSGGNTLLQFIATNATNTVRVKKEYIAV